MRKVGVWTGNTSSSMRNNDVEKSGAVYDITRFWINLQKLASRIINSPPLTDCLDSLSYWRNVTSLSLSYRYFHADCSSELVNCMSPSLPRPRCTRFSTSSHPYSVHLSNVRVNQYLHFFIPYTGKLWNYLFLSVFPPTYDLNFFKRGVSKHLSR